ncbi:MAG: metal ABC transporter permease [Trueperaceae bacterium]|nr:metal ABC transporter permease [Truepera sp.]HRN17575.1 metal ABC transporter permease [Trueperaceae bacterium]HRQ09979.1 metal ABC transporter permease [Trueperaceae bacterium]
MTILEALALPFFQRAVIAGLAIAVMAGVLGVFVVQRRLSFLGDGLAHAAFGGMGIGAYVIVTSGLIGSGVALLEHPLWIAMPFSLLAALVIAALRKRTRLSSDTAIGVAFAVSVALGVMFFSLIPPDVNLGVSVMDLLFGSILGVRRGDLIVIVVVAVLAVGALMGLWGRLGYATFDDELARSDGLHTDRLELVLFLLAALVIAVSASVVGIVLMAAYLVIPAAAARLLARTLAQMTLLSVLLGVVSTVVGLGLSFYWDVPSGATIVLTQAALFVPAAVFGHRR